MQIWQGHQLALGWSAAPINQFLLKDQLPAAKSRMDSHSRRHWNHQHVIRQSPHVCSITWAGHNGQKTGQDAGPPPPSPLLFLGERACVLAWPGQHAGASWRHASEGGCGGPRGSHRSFLCSPQPARLTVEADSVEGALAQVHRDQHVLLAASNNVVS